MITVTRIERKIRKQVRKQVRRARVVARDGMVLAAVVLVAGGTLKVAMAAAIAGIVLAWARTPRVLARVARQPVPRMRLYSPECLTRAHGECSGRGCNCGCGHPGRSRRRASADEPQF